MKLMVNEGSGEILDAFADEGARQVPAFATVVEVAGDPETFAWPHENGPSACRWAGGRIVANPAVKTVPRLRPIEAAGGDGAAWRGLTRFLAEKFAMSEAEIVEAIKTRAM